ncbi:hypothetical protein [Paenibacillus apiarius]|uniref:hypothetical protein n=1 Tax=Paenibacillus apiarius TaxID=46240 RepID=UPI003B3A0103
MNQTEVPKGMSKFYVGFSENGIPLNITELIHSLFTKAHVEYTPEGKVIVYVFDEENEKIDKFREDVKQLLLELSKENSVLAQKLARYHRISLEDR